MKKLIACLSGILIILVSALVSAITGGALEGERFRILVSTDIGGSDPDDFQSMVHLLVYADVFDIEGLVSSPPRQGRKEHILEVIDAYETDYANLCTYSDRYPAPTELRSVTKQGHTKPAPEQGFSGPTEGSRWIITQALKDDPRPLYILVWGSMTDVAQALHDDPTISNRIRIHSVGGWNTNEDQHARNYVMQHHNSVWWIENNHTLRGMFMGGKQDGDLGNLSFVKKHVKGHGALGDLFWSKKNDIKMGDTPTVTYLLKGEADKPETDHWGGRFIKTDCGPNYWTDIADKQYWEPYTPGAKTTNIWREDYLRDWQKRMEWCTKTNADTNCVTAKEKQRHHHE